MKTRRQALPICHRFALLLACGSAAAVSGCGYHLARSNPASSEPAPSAATTPAPANPGVGVVRTASRGTSPDRQARQFDPFWIEAAAEADRNIWMGNPAYTDPSAPAVGGSTLLSSQMTGFSLPANPDGPAGADTVEGLTHVSFAADGADFDPCLSRDGQFIAFASTQHRPTSDIYLKRTDGRTITQLTSDPAHDLMPAISPDGQRIAFASNRAGNWNLYVMSNAGGQAVQLTDDPSQEVSPSWSPDGKKLVFSRFGEMSGRWEMWVMDVTASASAEFLGYGLFPRWCPRVATGAAGRDRILFQRSRERGDRAFSLWTIDYKPGDASSPTEIVSSPSAALINADWSPDGERIVYASVENAGTAADLGGPTPAVSDLWMANIDGSGRVNLTNGRFMNLMPSWSKDGRIYFVSNRGGMTNLWAVGTDKAIDAASGPRTMKTNTEVAETPAETQEPPAP